MIAKQNVLLYTAALLLLLGFSACKNNPSDGKSDAPADRNNLPPGTTSVPATLVESHCWIEGENFYVAGRATNDGAGPEFRRLWLHLQILDAAGQPVRVNGGSTATVALLSEAIPPSGMSSFLAGWPLSAFSAPPDTVRLSDASGLKVEPGAILIPEEVGGIKMTARTVETATDSTMREQSWQVTGVINNPLDRPARAFACEVLIYGTDNKLWFTQWLSPLDPSRVLQQEREGPLAPQEKRRFGVFITYDGLPQALKDMRIGHIDVLASEDRE